MNLPFGYLITLVLVAICTFFALAAPGRTRLLAGLSFRLGLAVNELPFVVSAWLLAASVPAFVQGDLTSPIIAGAAALTMAGLVRTARPAGATCWTSTATAPGPPGPRS